ncbi:MAG: APC family permease [Planctomycetota bacterium]|jgi:amino acid transporter
MAILDQSKRLRKELSLWGVYAISLGATLSSGFFLLPGIAAAEAGPAVVLTYMIAVIPLVPGIISKTELCTAMPRAGGIYYFLDRSMGPVFGTIGGIGSWLTLVLKVGFALVGMGAYLQIFWHDVPIRVPRAWRGSCSAARRACRPRTSTASSTPGPVRSSRRPGSCASATSA